MNLVTPDIGLIFWTTLTFLILLFLLKKFAWKPILNMVKERDESIENALNSAEEAKKEMAALNAKNEELLQEAREERDKMLKEARDTKDKMISEAKEQAREEGNKLISNARESIETDKKAALADIKNQVATLSVEVAERILKDKLAEDGGQEKLVEKYIENINLN
ncbi:F0F1 ATP synthase subunit B [Salibacter sp.]|uniref:F0F1 ATP synthase subunit B n=1 Tax=Salibacter sp. TaxID=2010995 RepID=UPI00286FD042|nr:F0F1 ATP synthase subunit B [Salibacter sp.]MDR9398802.1 F0F1 ATP synthase subunit B [Salibacter sp.]MDR9487858.1 F0F1 ATP synthase subunit B [Salibacter sp.]